VVLFIDLGRGKLGTLGTLRSSNKHMLRQTVYRPTKIHDTIREERTWMNRPTSKARKPKTSFPRTKKTGRSRMTDLSSTLQRLKHIAEASTQRLDKFVEHQGTNW